MATYLKPPNLFGIVQPGIYRSNAPLEENLEFFRRLNLRTVLFLSPEVLLRSVVDFFEKMNVQVINKGLQEWKPEPSWTPICDEFIKEALEMILDQKLHPVLVCCTSGEPQIFQPSAQIRPGLLKSARHLGARDPTDSAASGLSTARAGTRARLLHEQYIEFFDVDLVTLPEQVPAWLVNYDLIDEREEEARIQELQKELSLLDDKEEAGLPAEEKKRLRQIRFILRCREAQTSTKLVTDARACTKQSLVDDDDDD